MQRAEADAVSIGDVISAFDAKVDQETNKLDELRTQMDEVTAEDLKGVNAPIPSQSAIKDGDESRFSLLLKLGRSIEDAKRQRFRYKEMLEALQCLAEHALFKRNGKTFDDLRESLQELGWYVPEDPNQPRSSRR